MRFSLGSLMYLWALLPAVSIASECASNIFAIEEIKGLATQNTPEFNQIPDYFPSQAKKLFLDANTLPINATDNIIKETLPKPTSVQNLRNLLFTYVWSSQEKDQLYTFQMRRYKGCISQLMLHTIAKNDKGHLVNRIIFQEMLVPTGWSGFRKPKPEECQIKSAKHQRFNYSKNGLSPKNIDLSTLPNNVQGIFKEHAGGDYNPEKLNTLYGPARQTGNQLVWNSPDSENPKVTVEVETERNCDVSMAIRWTDTDNNKHLLLKENVFSSKSKDKVKPKAASNQT